MNYLIAGASGLVGQNLLNLILADSNTNTVTALTRSALNVHHENLHNIISNFSDLDNQNLPKAEIAFCCLGTTIKKSGSQKDFIKVDHDYVINFAKACLKSGVQNFFFISAIGADPTSKIFYSRVKGQTEIDLEKIQFSKLIILRPSLLIGSRNDFRPLEQLSLLLSFLFVGPLGKYRPVKASVVAQTMLNLAKEVKVDSVNNSLKVEIISIFEQKPT